MAEKKRAKYNGIWLAAAVCALSLIGMSSPSQEDEDLRKKAEEIFGALPRVMSSEKNPITPEKVGLGKILFYEPRVSSDGMLSCARCHPVSLYGADGLKTSVGTNCQVLPRNSPTVFNAASQISSHWAGNLTDVEDQAQHALIAAYGTASGATAEEKLKAIKGYGPLFARAFPGEKSPVNAENFGKAVGAFERTMVTPARFDRFVQGDGNALADGEKRGLKTFIETGCMTCHSSPYFGGQVYQKFGVFEPYQKYTKSTQLDEGRSAVTKNEGDKYVFKVPILRNVEMTPPYFHDGSIAGLSDAVRIMGKIQLARNLTEKQIGEIAAFLKSLTGEIPEDVLKVPVLPAGE
ncbi:MAG: cytochrome c peroxidase [bacterium]|nr:cytochrome c peroxidase [bacterium]